MDTDRFTAAYNESRNGANCFYRHPLVRRFQYSDGVQECAEAGCYWLLDILATELPGVMRRHQESHGYIVVRVADGKATIAFEATEGRPLWTKAIPHTDMPAGDWTFEVSDEGHRFALILISEH